MEGGDSLNITTFRAKFFKVIEGKPTWVRSRIKEAFDQAYFESEEVDQPIKE